MFFADCSGRLPTLPSDVVDKILELVKQSWRGRPRMAAKNEVRVVQEARCPDCPSSCLSLAERRSALAPHSMLKRVSLFRNMLLACRNIGRVGH